jgi:hypothetical protein
VSAAAATVAAQSSARVSLQGLVFISILLGRILSA